MNEKQTAAPSKVRPTKKQKELLSFIENFIAEHGYSPSYREIMSGLNYNSVATVSLHVNNLMKRGQLINVIAQLDPLNLLIDLSQLKLPPIKLTLVKKNGL